MSGRRLTSGACTSSRYCFPSPSMTARRSRARSSTESGAVAVDAMIVLEVMTDELDRSWWADYRRELERRFRQKEILIRALSTVRL